MAVRHHTTAMRGSECERGVGGDEISPRCPHQPDHQHAPDFFFFFLSFLTEAPDRILPGRLTGFSFHSRPRRFEEGRGLCRDR